MPADTPNSSVQMTTPAVIGALLAGGQSQRFGTDKRQLMLNQHTLLQHCAARAAAQVAQLVLCTHDDLPPMAELAFPVVHDLDTAHRGPAAGIISSFAWLESQRLSYSWLATFACDTPYFPQNLISTLLVAANAHNADVVVPVHQGRLHWSFALWARPCLPDVVARFRAGDAALKRLAAAQRCHPCVIESPGDPFFNINTPEQWQARHNVLPHH